MMKKQMLTTLVSLLFTAMAGAQPAYDMKKIQCEKLNRGVVAVRNGNKVYVTWRLLSTDKKNEGFDIYRNGERLNKTTRYQGGTCYEDRHPLTGDVTYEVRGGRLNGSYTLKADSPNGYLPIPLSKPNGGTTPDGKTYEYEANDASIGDVDGDGQYEIFLKWAPTNQKDNSFAGFTGSTLIDCYTLEGRQLWRIDLGQNIRSGAHYTQFMVYDFDGDGRCEMMCKTADGTRDAAGRVIGDSTKDWRCHLPTGRNATKLEQKTFGRILDGPEYLTVFDGQTGRALATTDYVPARGDVKAWGDDYGNRVDRFLAGVAYLDGQHPSAIFSRGYYTRIVIVAWDWDGKQLRQRWVFDTNDTPWASFAGEGNHNMRIADFDGDGRDEITFGSMAVDDDGRGMYATGFGHGDAIHIVPDHQSGQLMIWDCHENKVDGVDLRDGKTGRIIFNHKIAEDVGRCMAADIDPTNPGYELWYSSSKAIYNIKGEVVHDSVGGRHTCNFGIWWDGDLLRETMDRGAIYKYDWQRNVQQRKMQFKGCAFNNSTKSNPCLSADIIGDWREEVLTRTADSNELRLYISPIATDHRMVCLEEDIVYRISVAMENVGYNQPPESGYYIGEK